MYQALFILFWTNIMVYGSPSNGFRETYWRTCSDILEKLMEAIINPIKTPEFLEKYVAMVCCRILVVNLEVYSHLNYI